MPFDPVTMGAAIAGGGSLLGGLFGASAKKAQAKQDKALWKQSVKMYGDFLNDPNSYLKQGADQYGAAIGTLNQGFKDARLNLNMAGSAARQTALTQNKQAGAATQQSMISRGLYGTTALDNAQRGLSSDLSRQLSQIDESVGSLLAGLSTQRAGAVAGAQQGYGSYLGQAYGAQQNSMENYINLLRDKPARFSQGAYYGGLLGGTAMNVGQMLAFGGAGKGA